MKCINCDYWDKVQGEYGICNMPKETHRYVLYNGRELRTTHDYWCIAFKKKRDTNNQLNQHNKDRDSFDTINKIIG